MDQDPPIDPSVEAAPRREPTLPVSTMTGQVTNTPQLGPGVSQEITPVSFILELSSCTPLLDDDCTDAAPAAHQVVVVCVPCLHVCGRGRTLQIRHGVS